MGGTKKEDRDFLQKYMTLTRCDLLFADAAILIEGASERLLMTRMIESVDSRRAIGSRLSARYLTIMEVGGAYAHVFFGLLSFLELRSLVLTDLDSVDGNNGYRACTVSASTGSSNSCIKAWFGDETITTSTLLNKQSSEKTKENRRLAFQIPEQVNGPCGRSFEDAFILANPELFALDCPTNADRERQALSQAQALEKKTDFALKYAMDTTGWVVPRYIFEGLEWLADGDVRPSIAAAKETTLST